MNDRIRRLALLAEQAIRETDLTEVNGGIHITPAFEKFAELIVRECLSYAKDGDLDFMKFMIKKNFGVEE